MSEDTTKSRNRSPNYPYLTLADAIEKTCIILDKDKLNPTSADVIVGHLGYNKMHGTSRRVLSAMKEYGLLEETGNRRFKVSNLGYKLCKNNEPESVREGLLKEAALTPLIFRSVIEEYKGDIPSPETLEDYLILEKDFSPDGASSFQKVLRHTVEFANITPDDFLENADNNQPLNQEGGKPSMLEQNPQIALSAQPQKFYGGGQFAQDASLPPLGSNETILNFKISRNSEARIIFYGEDVTQEAIEQLKTILDAQKPVYPTKEELEKERNQPKNATWHNKDFDQPVKVTGEIGEIGGKKYLSVEGSQTGVPEDELEFENKD